MDYILFLAFFYIFYLGAILGSFLNVVVVELERVVFSEERFSERVSFFWKKINRRSECPKCKKKLTVIDLFPLLSYLFLRAKCRGCGKKISPRYFFVEVFSGLVFVGLFWKFLQPLDFFSHSFVPIFLNHFFWWEFIFFLPILCGLILIFLFDFKHKIIPDVVMFPVFLYSLFFILFDFEKSIFVFENFLTDIFRAFSYAVPFFAIWFFSRGRAMGFADWKLIFVLSLLLDSSMQNLFFVFGAFWAGAIYSIPLLILKKNNLKSEVPFGPFILISFFLVYFFNLSYFSFLNIF
jgi:leader peptidase (prepilin peptidase)/N-methyltransferase